VQNQQDFLREAVVVFGRLAELAGLDSRNGLAQRLQSEGVMVLRAHAGPDYRRPLMKRLASCVLEHIKR
jgi:hypothetical protein